MKELRVSYAWFFALKAPMARVSISRMAPPKVLTLVFCVPPAVVLIGLAADRVGGGGHPPLGATLAYLAIYPTLTGYLSRAYLGTDFPSYPVILLALMEYPLVGFALGAIVARLKTGAQ